MLNKFSILSNSIEVLAACVIRLLAAWLTHGAPINYIIQCQLNANYYRIAYKKMGSVEMFLENPIHINTHIIIMLYPKVDWLIHDEAIENVLVNQTLRLVNLKLMSTLGILMNASIPRKN